MSKEGRTTNDKLDPPRDIEAISEPISSEKVDSVRVPTEASDADVHPDRDDIERADTDREFARDDRSGELLVTSKVPASLNFQLKRIPSSKAECFFCGESDCDQVFVANSKDPAKRKVLAVHNECVFDHSRLQVLASGGT